MKRILALILILCMTVGVCGCSTVGSIAENVADAAMAELKNQLTAVLEKNKVDVVEMKSDYRLENGVDFFVAVLVRCGSEEMIQTCVSGLGTVFSDSGYQAQTGQVLTHDQIPSGSITFDHVDYEGSYYVIYGYAHLDGIQ